MRRQEEEEGEQWQVKRENEEVLSLSSGMNCAFWPGSQLFSWASESITTKSSDSLASDPLLFM